MCVVVERRHGGPRTATIGPDDVPDASRRGAGGGPYPVSGMRTLFVRTLLTAAEGVRPHLTTSCCALADPGVTRWSTDRRDGLGTQVRLKPNGMVVVSTLGVALWLKE